MRWLAWLFVIACQRPVADPEVPEPRRRAPMSRPVATPSPPSVIRARILGIEIVGGDQIVTVAAGSDLGVSRAWTGCLLLRASDRCHTGGEIEIVRVEPRVTRARIAATDVLGGTHVLFRAPP